jgi:hypothetical protein
MDFAHQLSIDQSTPSRYVPAPAPGWVAQNLLRTPGDICQARHPLLPGFGITTAYAAALPGALPSGQTHRQHKRSRGRAFVGIQVNNLFAGRNRLVVASSAMLASNTGVNQRDAQIVTWG